MTDKDALQQEDAARSDDVAGAGETPENLAEEDEEEGEDEKSQPGDLVDHVGIGGSGRLWDSTNSRLDRA